MAAIRQRPTPSSPRQRRPHDPAPRNLQSENPPPRCRGFHLPVETSGNLVKLDRSASAIVGADECTVALPLSLTWKFGCLSDQKCAQEFTQRAQVPVRCE